MINFEKCPPCTVTFVCSLCRHVLITNHEDADGKPYMPSDKEVQMMLTEIESRHKNECKGIKP
jgi:hypothetical protein